MDKRYEAYVVKRMRKRLEIRKEEGGKGEEKESKKRGREREGGEEEGVREKEGDEEEEE